MEKVSSIEELLEEKVLNLEQLRKVIVKSTSASDFLFIKEKFQKIHDQRIGSSHLKQIHVLILGYENLSFLSEMIEGLCLLWQIKIKCTLAAYNSFSISETFVKDSFKTDSKEETKEEAKDSKGASSQEGFVGFDFVLLWPFPLEFSNSSLMLSKSDVHQRLEKEKECLLKLSQELHKKTDASILLCNYIPQTEVDLGHEAHKISGAQWNFSRQLNFLLASESPDFVKIIDLEKLAMKIGSSKVFDSRSWFQYRFPASPDFLYQVAKESLQTIHEIINSPKKVLCIDFDNTLWGGVFAEETSDKIKIGMNDPIGEAFCEFQKYLGSLKERGILLFGVTKNDSSIIKEVFHLPGMILKEEDFISIQASWKPKSLSLCEISQQINISLDQFVFIDDELFEIEEVKQAYPMVECIHLDKDLSLRLNQLKESRFFFLQNMNSDDFLRHQSVKNQIKIMRENKISHFESSDFLLSLNTEVTVEKASLHNLDRITQLINKTNQFNLTSFRYSKSEIENMMNDPRFIIYAYSARDRLSNYGIISVVILKRSQSQNQNLLMLDSWLMSCRVFNRQIENYVWNHICDICRSESVEDIHAVYRFTQKNGIVKNLFRHFGGSIIESNEKQETYLIKSKKAEVNGAKFICEL